MRLLRAILVLSAICAPCAALSQTTTTTLPPTTADQLCLPAAPSCTIAGVHAVVSGSFLDFGTRSLTLAANASLTAAPGGTMAIKAGSLTLNSHASLAGDGSAITVMVDGAIVLAATSAIDVSSVSAGFGLIDISAGTNITLGGTLNASSTDINGDGGTINVLAGGNVTVSDDIVAAGGGQGSGGDVSIVAHGSLVVNRQIDSTGGEFDGGTIDLEADGALTVNTAARLDVSALNGGLSGNGGFITLSSNVQGDVRLLSSVAGKAMGSDPNTAEGGGDGGEIDVTAINGSVLVDPPTAIAMNGGAGDGGGGTIDFEASGDVNVTQPIAVPGNGVDSCGGTATLIAGGNLTFKAIDASGGSCGTGSLTALAQNVVTVPAEVNADGAGSAGAIQIGGRNAIIGGNVHASGGSGFVNVQACILQVTATGRLQASGALGTNLLQSAGQMSIAGALSAGTANQLRYLNPATPPSITCSNCITPPPDIKLDPTLPDFCTSINATTSTTIPATSTSTTLPTGTTTTSLIAGTTTTSSTPVTTSTVPVTTTTIAVTTTSSTIGTTTSTVALTTTSTTITSTTSTAPQGTSTTSSTTPGTPSTTTTTAPPATCGAGCDDGDPCTDDACVNGTCEHTPKESFDAVSCRLDAMHELISTAPSGAIRSAAIRQRLLAKLGKLSALVAKGRAGGARGGKALRRADRGAAALASLIQKLAARGKIEPGLGARLGTLASSLKPSIDRITTP